MKHFSGGSQVRKILLSCVSLVCLLWVWAGVPVGLAQVAPAHRQMVNKPAPDFTLRLFSGKKVELKDYRGKVLVLNFWHSG